MNSSHTIPVRPKTVQRWINAQPLRAKYWDHDCPECGYGMLSFHLDGAGPAIKKVRCMAEACDWEATT